MHSLVLAALFLLQPLKPLIMPDDYPIEAIENGWQGDVVADVRVDEKGRVTGCTIVRSSGHRVLDSATCKAFRKRGKFEPKRDTAGRAVPFVYRTDPPTSWRLNH
jgi:protein TonB